MKNTPFVPSVDKILNYPLVRILISLKDQPSLDSYNLFERLQKAGIYPVGGAQLGDRQHAILFRRPEDTDHAIAVLKNMGIDAQRG